MRGHPKRLPRGRLHAAAAVPVGGGPPTAPGTGQDPGHRRRRHHGVPRRLRGRPRGVRDVDPAPPAAAPAGVGRRGRPRLLRHGRPGPGGPAERRSVFRAVRSDRARDGGGRCPVTLAVVRDPFQTDTLAARALVRVQDRQGVWRRLPDVVRLEWDRSVEQPAATLLVEVANPDGWYTPDQLPEKFPSMDLPRSPWQTLLFPGAPVHAYLGYGDDL